MCSQKVPSYKRVAITSGGFKGSRGQPLPLIDRMHLKTSETFARKCIIYAENFNFFGRGRSLFPRPHPLHFRPLFQISGSAASHNKQKHALI